MSVVQSSSVVKVNSSTSPAQTVLDTTCIFDKHQLTGICHLQRTGLLQFMDGNAEDNIDG
jgi:hypothetical protein